MDPADRPDRRAGNRLRLDIHRRKMLVAPISAASLGQYVLEAGTSTQQQALRNLQNSLASGNLGRCHVRLPGAAKRLANFGDLHRRHFRQQFATFIRCNSSWQRSEFGRSFGGAVCFCEGSGRLERLRLGGADERSYGSIPIRAIDRRPAQHPQCECECQHVQQCRQYKRDPAELVRQSKRSRRLRVDLRDWSRKSAGGKPYLSLV